MQTQIKLPGNSRDFTGYYEHVVDHCHSEEYYLMRDHDAVGFILGMGRIEVDEAPYRSGKELLDYLMNEQHHGSVEAFFPHKAVLVCCKLIDYHPYVLVTSSAVQMRTLLPGLLGEVTRETEDKLDALMKSRGEVYCPPVAVEDPADAVIIFRPDLIQLSDCYEDLRKLGYIGVIMEPGLIQIPYEHWKGGVHIQVTPVRDNTLKGFRLFEDKRLWSDEYCYVPKSFLAAENAAISIAA
jgi:hypothetical protein